VRDSESERKKGGERETDEDRMLERAGAREK